MRFTLPALALAALCALTASAGQSAPSRPLDPRAIALEGEGRAALAAGSTQAATDAFEAALAIDPGNTLLIMDLAAAARRDGLQGKALHYYRGVLETNPNDLAALTGEGEALAEKGAVEKARRDLALVQGLCGSDCGAAHELSAAIAKAPAPEMVSAEAVKPTSVVAN